VAAVMIQIAVVKNQTTALDRAVSVTGITSDYNRKGQWPCQLYPKSYSRVQRRSE